MKVVNIEELKYAKHLIQMVIKQYLTSLILVSDGGLGKSFLVQQQVEKHIPKKYVYRSGHVTPLALYKLLYNNKDKVIILDDVEELLDNEVNIGILKSAMWNVNGKRVVTFETTSEKADGVPNLFEFEGGIIILCNIIPKQNNPIMKALTSRTAQHYVQIPYHRKIQIMNQLIDSKDELTKTDKRILKSVLKERTSECTDNFNLRTAEKLISYYLYNKKHYKSRKQLYLGLFEATNEKDEDKYLVKQLTHKYSSVKKQVSKFQEKTGKSRATFFRIKKSLK